jgi:hypothetical protein
MRSAGVGELLGGGDEHLEIVDASSQVVVGTVAETGLTPLRRAGRLLNNLFLTQQRRSLDVRDGTGRPVLTIAKPVPSLAPSMPRFAPVTARRPGPSGWSGRVARTSSVWASSILRMSG